jgi:peptidoglycan/xylan/chitin deacetylase (PgdA/CDA1 family)
MNSSLAGRAWSRAIHSYKIQGLCQTVVGVETSERVAAITFDDGPDPRGTPAILDTLARHDARGTFFVLGSNVLEHPELTRRMVAGGHVLGNHTNSHPCLPDLTPPQVARELAECRRAIVAVTGTAPRLMRPPFGAQRVDTWATARALGYLVIHWSSSGVDWEGHPGSVIAEHALAELTPGGIVLLHDGWKPKPGAPPSERDELLADRTPTVEGLEMILETKRREGFRFVTVPELLALGPVRRQRWFWD